MAIGCEHERAGKTETSFVFSKQMRSALTYDISVTVHSKLGRINQDQTHTARIQVNILDSHHECDLDF